MKKEEPTGRAKGGVKRAENLSDAEKKNIAKQGAAARWGYKVLHRGNFKDHFGINIDCYVLDDTQKTAVISQGGMAQAMGLSRRGDRLTVFVNSKNMENYIGRELKEKLDKPLIFQRSASAAADPTGGKAHGYDVTILIDLCESILAARKDGKLAGSRYDEMAKQAQIILMASAKSGIKNLVYALVGYSPSAEEVIAAFKLYVLEEARDYEKEFPPQLYREWYRLYDLPKPEKNKPWKFMHLTNNHVYQPLAKSNGRILKLARSNKKDGGARNKRLHQFLSEVGVKALRMHLGQLLGIAQISDTKEQYEKNVKKVFGDQNEMDV